MIGGIGMRLRSMDARKRRHHLSQESYRYAPVAVPYAPPCALKGKTLFLLSLETLLGSLGSSTPIPVPDSGFVSLSVWNPIEGSASSRTGARARRRFR